MRGLGPTTPGIRRDRTWPGQSRKACVSRTGRRGGRRARGGQAEGRVRVKVVLSESGGVLGAGNSLSGGSGGGAARCALPGACGWRGARRAERASWSSELASGCKALETSGKRAVWLKTKPLNHSYTQGIEERSLPTAAFGQRQRLHRWSRCRRYRRRGEQRRHKRQASPRRYIS